MRPLLIALTFVFVFGFSSLAVAQAQAPAPQSARQALIEMFFGSSPNHLERHLAEVTKKSFLRMNSSEGQNLLGELSSLSSQIKASGAKIETFDTGATILTVEDKAPQAPQRLEITVERDDLVGDEDEIELALHLPQQVTEQALPITPHLTFAMKTEADVWRLTDITVTVKFPLADPDFLKTIEDSQRRKSEQLTIWSMHTISAAEEGYHSKHGSYACSLAGLADATKPGPDNPGVYFDPELASGKKGGYVFAVSGCDALHYKAVAEPALDDSGQRAFCTDERGTIRASADGKATSCLSSGEEIDQKTYPGFGATIID